MNSIDPIRDVLRRYLPVVMGVIFSAILALTAAVTLAGQTYLRDWLAADSKAAYSWFACMGLGVIVIQANFMMLRGRSWWVWVMVAFFIACLLTVLPTIHYRPHMFMYAESLLWPLLGLLLLNSKRHREMREKYVEFRHQRMAFLQALKRKESRQRRR